MTASHSSTDMFVVTRVGVDAVQVHMQGRYTPPER